jgi:hypothetical protein
MTLKFPDIAGIPCGGNGVAKKEGLSDPDRLTRLPPKTKHSESIGQENGNGMHLAYYTNVLAQ